MPEPRACLEAEPEQPPPVDERRASVRYPAHFNASLRPASEGLAPWEARVHDISSLGVGLVVPRGFEPGTVLEIDLENPSWNAVRTLLARVVHAEPDAGGDWLLGCAFIHELGDADLELFKARRVRPPAPDARRWVRVPCNVATVCYAPETVPGEQARARVVNISPGGIGLLLPCEFPRGTLLHLELPTPEGRPAARVLVRVLRPLEHGNGDWFLGCEFVGQLSEADLAQLLAEAPATRPPPEMT